MKIEQYALAMGLTLGVATAALLVLGHPSAPQSAAAAASFQRAGPAATPKLSPAEFRDLMAEGALAQHPLYQSALMPEPLYDPVMRVTASHRARGAVLKDHQKLAKVLNDAKIGPPQGRIAHFAWLNQNPYRLLGWGASVDAIEPIPGGVAVTLVVGPSFQYDKGSATSADYYLEKYAIFNGQVHFVEGVDPTDAEPGVAITD
jgi:hypothetical protein